MFFGATAIESFLYIIAIFSGLYWILPRKYNWISFLVLTVLLSYMAYQLVPGEHDDLYRYYNAITDLRESGWDKMKEFIEADNHDMKNYITVRYLFWLVSRTSSNHWLQTIAVGFTYGTTTVMILLAQRKFNIARGYVYLGTLFFLSTFFYYDLASGVRNGLCFAIITFCSYIFFVEKKFKLLCVIGYVIAFYLHSAGLLAVSLVVVTLILYKIDSVFVNFVFMFSLIGGNFLVQMLAEDSDNELLLSIAGRAERHVGGELISSETNFRVNMVTVLISVIIVLFVSYYFKQRKGVDATHFYKYVSLTMFFVTGSVFSGMIFMRFTRWIVPVIVALALMIGLQKQSDDIEEKGESYYKYYAIPLERFLYKVKPFIIFIVLAYSLIHLWYDYNGSSLTFAHFGYEWEALGYDEYTW